MRRQSRSSRGGESVMNGARSRFRWSSHGSSESTTHTSKGRTEKLSSPPLASSKSMIARARQLALAGGVFAAAAQS